MTKLIIPPLRQGVIPRQELIRRLDQGLEMDHRLFLISAPAGFGKTTLLSEWIHSPRPTEPPYLLPHPSPDQVGWVSVDAGDNEPIRFWVYFLSALRRIFPDVGESMLANLMLLQPSPLELLQADLINQIAQQNRRGILVLDDFHLIENKTIHQSLQFWVENQPPNLSLVISSRMDPPLPLARLRARRQLTELRERDIRFSRQETARFMRQVLSADLSPDDLASLDRHVEGWIAGLQMLSMTIRRNENASEMIADLAGSHRFILDYLTEEVFNSQAENVQQFLLETSILEALTADLCDAVTGREDSQKVLDYLETANLFIVALDDERRWYRYHQLFRDLLRDRLQKKYPSHTAELYRRAAQWYSGNGYIQEAFDFAMTAADVDYAAQLLEMEARLKGVLPVAWLERLPREAIRRRPLLCAIYAGSLAIQQGDTKAEIEDLQQDAERGLEGMCLECEVDPLYKVLVRGHIALTSAILALGEGSPNSTIEMASQALAQLPEELVSERCSALLIQSQGYLFLGETDKALASVDGALMLARRYHHYPRLYVSACLRQLILSSAGRLNEAVKLCSDMLDEVARLPENHPLRRLPELGAVHIGLGRLLLEQNHLDEAEKHLRQGLNLISRSGQAGILRDGLLGLCRLYCARGKWKPAAEIIAQYTGLYPLQESFQHTLEARMDLAVASSDADALARLRRWTTESHINLEDAQIDSIFTGYRSGYLAYLVYAEALILLASLENTENRKDQLLPVVRFLTKQLGQARKQGRDGITLELSLLLAMAYHTAGVKEDWQSPMETALHIGRQEGYFTVFIEHGKPMYRLLASIAQTHGGDEYLQKLLAAFPPEWAISSPKIGSSPQPGLAEGISEREVEVLRLIAEGLSNQEIAERLFLAISTVKKHINNLYGKMAVGKRTEAIKRGRELGLL